MVSPYRVCIERPKRIWGSVLGKARLATIQVEITIRLTYLCNFCLCLKSGAHRSIRQAGFPSPDDATRLDGPDSDSVQNHLALPGRLELRRRHSRLPPAPPPTRQTHTFSPFVCSLPLIRTPDRSERVRVSETCVVRPSVSPQVGRATD